MMKKYFQDWPRPLIVFTRQNSFPPAVEGSFQNQWCVSTISSLNLQSVGTKIFILQPYCVQLHEGLWKSHIVQMWLSHGNMKLALSRIIPPLIDLFFL